MREKTSNVMLIAVAAFVCLAAMNAGYAGSGEGRALKGSQPGAFAERPIPSRDEPPGELVKYFRARGENCYLVFSNFGLFGCYGFQVDHGFHYNVGVYSPPERYKGLYSWTDAPTLANYHNFIDTTATLPFWLELPAEATTLRVEYRAKWSIEENFDGVELEIAAAGQPTNWKNLRPTSAVRGSGQIGQPDTSRYYYEGEENVWKLEKADVSSYRGKKVKLRFHFRSDMSNRQYYHGIYVDEFRVVRGTSTDLYYNGFEKPGTDDWETDVIRGNEEVDEWGYSQALPAEVNFLNNGELIVGASSSYVADAFEPDWTATSLGWDKFVTYSNAETRGLEMPEYRIDQYVYPYRDFVIVDCYVKNGKPETQDNIYAGVRMKVEIKHNASERDDDERVTYKSAQRLAMFYDDGQLDRPLCGIMYLHPNKSQQPKSVNFTTSMGQWTEDAINFTMMSNGEKDYQNTASSVNRWAVVIGHGPHTLAQSKVFRFSFAIIGGDNQSDILSNSDRAWDVYKTLPDHTPIRVAPTSFGKIKAIFR